MTFPSFYTELTPMAILPLTGRFRGKSALLSATQEYGYYGSNDRQYSNEDQIYHPPCFMRFVKIGSLVFFNFLQRRSKSYLLDTRAYLLANH